MSEPAVDSRDWWRMMANAADDQRAEAYARWRKDREALETRIRELEGLLREGAEHVDLGSDRRERFDWLARVRVLVPQEPAGQEAREEPDTEEVRG